MGVDEYFYYETIGGDTYDILALDFYSDEYMANIIIEANPVYCDTIVFDAGTKLKIPIVTRAAAVTLPPWKR